MRIPSHPASNWQREDANTIACWIVCSRLDYCNSIPYGVTKNNVGRLQRVQTALAMVVCGAPHRSFATVLRRSLYWLPIKQRIAITKWRWWRSWSGYTSNRCISPNLSSTTDRRGHCGRLGRTCRQETDRVACLSRGGATMYGTARHHSRDQRHPSIHS